MAQYDYTISTAFSNGVSSDRLTQEIQQSASITIALDRIDTAVDTCSIFFRATLSPGEETALNALVAAHSGLALEPDPAPVHLHGIDMNRDNRLIVQPVTLGKGLWHYWHSVGDAGAVLGAGTRFTASRSTAGDTTTTWSYRDPVFIGGGFIKYQGAQLGDWVRFTIYAPATPITPNGGGTGNCNLVSGVLVPAAGNGAWDVDLNTAIPVPTSEDPAQYSGFWDYEMPADMMGRGTITPSVPGQGKFHLIPARIPLDGFVRDEALLGEGIHSYEPQNINVSLCLPGWEFECVLHNEAGGHNLEAVWRVLMARYWTTM